ncbi:hypothetical protein LTR74_008055 [Friedmanniomyces endolithicus]|nr:hypothetical protein LTR74_008055 [Friedmanniomyces endolithicus]
MSPFIHHYISYTRQIAHRAAKDRAKSPVLASPKIPRGPFFPPSGSRLGRRNPVDRARHPISNAAKRWNVGSTGKEAERRCDARRLQWRLPGALAERLASSGRRLLLDSDIDSRCAIAGALALRFGREVLGAAVVECVLLFVDVDGDEDLDEDEDLVDDNEDLVVEEGVERELEDEDLVEEEEVVVVVGAWYLLGLPAVVVLWGGGVGVS